MQSTERDLPLGHPSAADYDPASPEAKEWQRLNVHPAGERDFPVGHPGAADNPNPVTPSNPLETARDFSRPETVRPPARPIEDVQDDSDGKKKKSAK